jgi:hypothetical protein
MTTQTAIRGRAALAAEAGGLHPWCGPSAVALITGRPYPAAEQAIRAAGSTRQTGRAYRPGRRLTTTYWPDLLLATARALPSVPGGAYGGDPVAPQLFTPQTLAAFARIATPGLWLLRVTGHFLVLWKPVQGVPQLFDNALTREPLNTRRARPRRRVTHAARILTGPMLEALEKEAHR